MFIAGFSRYFREGPYLRTLYWAVAAGGMLGGAGLFKFDGCFYIGRAGTGVVFGVKL